MASTENQTLVLHPDTCCASANSLLGNINKCVLKVHEHCLGDSALPVGDKDSGEVGGGCRLCSVVVDGVPLKKRKSRTYGVEAAEEAREDDEGQQRPGKEVCYCASQAGSTPRNIVVKIKSDDKEIVEWFTKAQAEHCRKGKPPFVARVSAEAANRDDICLDISVDQDSGQRRKSVHFEDEDKKSFFTGISNFLQRVTNMFTCGRHCRCEDPPERESHGGEEKTKSDKSSASSGEEEETKSDKSSASSGEEEETKSDKSSASSGGEEEIKSAKKSAPVGGKEKTKTAKKSGPAGGKEETKSAKSSASSGEEEETKSAKSSAPSGGKEKTKSAKKSAPAGGKEKTKSAKSSAPTGGKVKTKSAATSDSQGSLNNLVVKVDSNSGEEKFVRMSSWENNKEIPTMSSSTGLDADSSAKDIVEILGKRKKKGASSSRQSSSSRQTNN